MAAESGNLRCFIAVELPDAMKSELARVQGKLKDEVARVMGMSPERMARWVAPEGIHITLKFLGATAATLVPDLEASLARLKAGAKPCTVTVGGLGMFPSASRPRVIWVGVGGETESLADLQRRVEEATAPLGFPPETRAFSPHLTLARVREELGGAERKLLGGIVAGTKFDPAVSLRVSEISLMRSELLRGGARYTRLTSVAV